jgi:hypothetical protein
VLGHWPVYPNQLFLSWQICQLVNTATSGDYLELDGEENALGHKHASLL